MHLLMKIGLAIIACALPVGLGAALFGIWQAHPGDMLVANVVLTALFTGVAGFGVFVTGYMIDMAN